MEFMDEEFVSPAFARGLQTLHNGGVPVHPEQLNVQSPHLPVHTLLHSPPVHWTDLVQLGLSSHPSAEHVQAPQINVHKSPQRGARFVKCWLN
ncbi:19693_t:CDS:2, partial [Funneliformis geosporum]